MNIVGIKAFVLANLVPGHALCGPNSQFGNVPSFGHQHVHNLHDDFCIIILTLLFLSRGDETIILLS